MLLGLSCTSPNGNPNATCVILPTNYADEIIHDLLGGRDN